MDETITMFNNKCKAYIAFMLAQQQWSGLSQESITHWLENFRTLPPKEIYLVYKLLTNLIYFSEKDVIELLKEGVYRSVGYDTVLSKQIESDFCLSPQALNNTYDDEKRETFFIPLLDNDAPHESGNYISRLLVQQGIIQSDHSIFADKLPEKINSCRIRRIVIVDDCVGSGLQLATFWAKTTVGYGTSRMLLRDFCKANGIEPIYLTLFGYDQNIISLRKNFSDLKIYCVRMLNDSLRIFNSGSYVWKDDEEQLSAKETFSSLCKEAGIPLLGFSGLDFAFIMHQTIPDWSLPLFWKENANWNLLVRRKNSNA